VRNKLLIVTPKLKVIPYSSSAPSATLKEIFPRTFATWQFNIAFQTEARKKWGLEMHGSDMARQMFSDRGCGEDVKLFARIAGQWLAAVAVGRHAMSIISGLIWSGHILRRIISAFHRSLLPLGHDGADGFRPKQSKP
jgi:hypothetical protein